MLKLLSLVVGPEINLKFLLFYLHLPVTINTREVEKQKKAFIITGDLSKGPVYVCSFICSNQGFMYRMVWVINFFYSGKAKQNYKSQNNNKRLTTSSPQDIASDEYIYHSTTKWNK